MSKNHTFVDIKNYVDSLKTKGVKRVIAVKKGCITARPAVPGEKIETWTSDGKLESVAKGAADCFVVTKCDEAGNPLVDSFGYTNSWQMPAAKLQMKYDKKGHLYCPKYIEQEFIQADDDICFSMSTSGSEDVKEYVSKGGYLNITNPDDVYGIAEAEFSETYRIVR